MADELREGVITHEQVGNEEEVSDRLEPGQVLLIAPITGRAQPRTRAELERQLEAKRCNSAVEVFEAFGREISAPVTGPDGSRLTVRIAMKGSSTFSPRGLVNGCPELMQLYALQQMAEKLCSSEGRTVTREELSEWAQGREMVASACTARQERDK